MTCLEISNEPRNASGQVSPEPELGWPRENHSVLLEGPITGPGRR